MKPFKLSEDVERELAEIFTPACMGAVESACGHYLYESGKEKPGVVEDGQVLIEIGKGARELRQLLKKSRTALERVNLHVSEEYGKHDTLSFIEGLKEQLRILDNMCKVNPASERALSKKLGRPTGTKNTAERMLAFYLWEIYRQAHGKVARRSTNILKEEVGPLTRAAAILGPVLGLPSNLTRSFREINQNYGH